MKFKSVAKSSRSLTIEMINDDIYYSAQSYDVLVNGEILYEQQRTNVISIYDLLPDTEYTIAVVTNDSHEKTKVEEAVIRTLYESVCLYVTKFGAVGDGVHDDSQALQAAIYSCPKDGTVYIPKGIYYTKPLFLKDDITIYLEKDAVVLGHTDRHLYPILPGYTVTTDEKDEYYLGTWEGNPLDSYASLITGIHVNNVSFVGQGTINGNADHSDWWENPKTKRGAWRPRTIFLNQCENILFQGVTVTNSPSWTIHPYFSRNLSFIDMSVKNDKHSPNTDGLDPESCSNVRIIGVNFSVGDDCIAIKAGKLYMGRRLKQPSQQFSIRNCRMRHGHGAVVLGSEMSGGIREIEVSQCIFEETDRGLRIKTRRGRGEDAIIDSITFEKIYMKDVLTPFVINMFYFCDPDGKTNYVWTKEKLPVDEWTPYLGHFTFTDIQCVNAEVAGAYFYGLPEQPIAGILMNNVSIDYKEEAVAGRPAMMSFADPVKKAGIVAEYVNYLEMHNVVLNGYEGERLTLNGVGEVKDLKQ